MAELTGSEILARSLKAEGVEDLFFIMGGPMLLAEAKCIEQGIRMIDVRHEQAAAFAAQAYSRVTQRPGVCMAASGPAAINLSTGLANALIDCCPVVGFGGSSPAGQFGRQVFQEIDQVAIMKPMTKWADRVYNVKRIPEQVNAAWRKWIDPSKLQIVMVTPKAAALKQAMQSPSPIHYQKDAHGQTAPKPKELLAADAVIEKLPLPYKEIEIIPVDKMFE